MSPFVGIVGKDERKGAREKAWLRAMGQRALCMRKREPTALSPIQALPSSPAHTPPQKAAKTHRTARHETTAGCSATTDGNALMQEPEHRSQGFRVSLANGWQPLMQGRNARAVIGSSPANPCFFVARSTCVGLVG